MSTENKNLKSLRERAKEFDVRLPFMENRKKGDTKELLGQDSTINEYGFLPNEAGEVYAVFTVAERSDKFYFGGTVITDRLLKLEEDGYHEAIVTEGLPVRMSEAKSKNNRTFINVVFFPED